MTVHKANRGHSRLTLVSHSGNKNMPNNLNRTDNESTAPVPNPRHIVVRSGESNSVAANSIKAVSANSKIATISRFSDREIGDSERLTAFLVLRTCFLALIRTLYRYCSRYQTDEPKTRAFRYINPFF